MRPTMQQAVSAQPDRLGLRVGIDAGEPIHEGGDLYGTPVVVARRLCDAAEGGQVLVSDVVRLLLRPPPAGAARRRSGRRSSRASTSPSSRTPSAGARRARACGSAAGWPSSTTAMRLDERLPSRQARVLFALLVLERPRAEPRDDRRLALARRRAAVTRRLDQGAADGRPAGLRSRERRGPRRACGSCCPRSDGRHRGGRGGAQPRPRRRSSGRSRGGAMRLARHAAALTGDELLAGLSAPWIDERREGSRSSSLRALEIEARAALDAGRPPPPNAPRAGSSSARPTGSRPTRCCSRRSRSARQPRRGDARLRPSAHAPARRAGHRAVAGARGAARPAARRRRGPRPRARAPRPFPAALARAAERPFVARADELDRLRRGVGRGARGRGAPRPARRRAGDRQDQRSPRGSRARRTKRAPRCCSAAATPRRSCPYEPFVEALRQLPEAVAARARRPSSRA